MHKVIALLMLALLGLTAAPPAGADDFDAFGIIDDGKTLDEVAPDDGSRPPPLPAPEDGAPPPVGAVPPAGAAIPAPPLGAAPVAAPPLAVAPLAEAPPADTPPVIPDGWEVVAVDRARMALPPGFTSVNDGDESKQWLKGQMSPPEGTVAGLMLERFRSDEDMIPPGEVISDGPATVSGLPFRRVEVIADMGGGISMHTLLMVSDAPLVDDKKLLATFGTVGIDFETERPMIETALATLHLAEPAAAPPVEGVALDGLLRYRLPEGWLVHPDPSGDSISFSPEPYEGYFTVARGDAARALLAEMGDGAPESASVAGQAADRVSRVGDDAPFVDRTRMVSGRYDYFRLLRCVDDQPVMVVLAGRDGWLYETAFQAALDGLTLEAERLTSCAGDPWAGGPSASAAALPAEAVAAAPAAGTQAEVGGVTFTLPEGWEVTYDTPDDKIFASPDATWTLMAFWWFPDEPLLGYDDITEVAHVVIDHEPVTRIHHDIGNTRSIQSVTERARDDGRRFIFTLEGMGVDKAELAALTETLTASLRLGAGFGAAATPDAAATRAFPTGWAVRFSDGAQGWTGENAELSISETGGPDGSGVLTAFTPGDGQNGYLLAPPELLGDWSGNDYLSLELVTGEGEPVGPYDYGGRGDIYLESGDMSASIAFPDPVGPDWTVENIRFDAPDWRLTGAGSIDQILRDVTAFHIRIEYLRGDAMASIWTARLMADVAGEGFVAADPEEPIVGLDGWARYVNTRFGTGLDYPADRLAMQPPPENGDGRTFVSLDGGVVLRVFGQHNIDDLDGRAMLARDRAAGGYDKVTYDTARAGRYTMSGYVEGDIFYRSARIDPDEGVFHVFEITYPKSDRAFWDKAVERMAKSFMAP